MISSQTTSSATKRPFRDVTNAVHNNSKINKNNNSKVKTGSKVTVVAKNQALLRRRDQAPCRPISTPNNATSYQYTGQFDDIDKRDAPDPLCVTAYVQDMYHHYRSKESVGPMYMSLQPELTGRMRAIVVDWLVDIHHQVGFSPETLYLAVNLLDRYLAQKPAVSRPRLQLVGATAFFIASKYEETFPVALDDLVYMCDNAYTFQDILVFETEMLQTLEYRITVPTAHVFLLRFLKAGHADKKIVQLSCYLLDGTLQNYSLNRYLPSQLAAAAVFIARRTIGRNPWSPTLLEFAKYSHEEIAPIARDVLVSKSSPFSSELVAVNKKYSLSRFGSVADTAFQCDF